MSGDQEMFERIPRSIQLGVQVVCVRSSRGICQESRSICQRKSVRSPRSILSEVKEVSVTRDQEVAVKNPESILFYRPVDS